MDIFWNCLTFKTDILLHWFCMFISDKAVWNSVKLRFEQFNVRFYWFLTPSLQYLVLKFADTWASMSLKSPWIWIFLTCTNPSCCNALGWISLNERSAQMKARIMYKTVNHLAPQRLCDTFQNSNTINDYNLRGSSTFYSQASDGIPKKSSVTVWLKYGIR
jgi:hypothetical protein